MDKTMLLFGARQGTGLHLARLARRQGWEVSAVLRPDADADELAKLGCQILFADLMDPPAPPRAGVAAAQNRGVAVSALGGFPGGPLVDRDGNIHAIDAAFAAGVGWFLLVSSLGAGESRAFASPRLIGALGSILDAKTVAEDHLRARFPDRHTILRPGALTDDSASGLGTLYPALDVHGSLGREDLADLIFRCLAPDEPLGGTFSALDSARRLGTDTAPGFSPPTLPDVTPQA